MSERKVFLKNVEMMLLLLLMKRNWKALLKVKDIPILENNKINLKTTASYEKE